MTTRVVLLLAIFLALPLLGTEEEEELIQTCLDSLKQARAVLAQNPNLGRLDFQAIDDRSAAYRSRLADVKLAAAQAKKIDANTPVAKESDPASSGEGPRAMLADWGQTWRPSTEKPKKLKRGEKRPPEYWYIDWSQSTFRSLAFKLGQDPDDVHEVKPTSKKFRDTLKAQMVKAFGGEDDPRYKALFLYYGLDGNTRRNVAMIARQLGCSYAKARTYVVNAQKVFDGEPGIELMKAMAKETGVELKYYKDIGYTAYEFLRRIKVSDDSGADEQFKKIPIDIIPVESELITKLKGMNIDTVYQLDKYFHEHFFGFDKKTYTGPLTDAEYDLLYKKLDPIFNYSRGGA